MLTADFGANPQKALQAVQSHTQRYDTNNSSRMRVALRPCAGEAHAWLDTLQFQAART